MTSAIYRILCTASGKVYIGSAVNPANRWAVHRHNLNRGRHHSAHLQRAWDKHGESAFVFEIIEAVDDPARLIEREQHYLDLVKPFGDVGYNISPVAGSTRGAKRTPEQIERMAAHFRGKKLTPEHRAKIGAASQGRKHAPETLEKMREARLRNNHQVGRPLTEAQKRALHRSGADHPWFGRQHSEETRRRMSLDRATPVMQIRDDGKMIEWPTAGDAAAALGLKDTASIYRAIRDPRRRAAGCAWRRVQDRAVVS